MTQPYQYVRFRWSDIDLLKVATELAEKFKVEKISLQDEEKDVSPYVGEGLKLKVVADTLTAILTSMRAILSQRTASPFTGRDLELRERILEIYPHDRAEPFSFSDNKEPEFEQNRGS